MKKAALIFTTLCIALLFCACETRSDREENKKVSGETRLNRSVFKLLQGRWRNRDDAKAMIEFKDHYYWDYYDNKKLDESVFTLAKTCNEEQPADSTGQDESYLISNDQCWHINTIDDSLLDMTYTIRGNTLRYIKIR